MDTKTIAAAFNFPAAAAAAFGLHFGARNDAVASFNNGHLSPLSIPVDYTPESAEARLIDYRGEKVAAFEIDTDTLICLPQAYELFLKHLVGGLHTVYTKLKRLEIVPRVCNVEQVRALRSLGAIQPGVNRCKLISCTDFDKLYKDCTSASSRPGRPPKRSPVPFGSTPSVGGGSGGIPLPKKLKLAAAAAATDLSGIAASTTSADGNKTPAGLFGSQLAPNLFPFFPLTPQQFVMSQIMNSNAALAKQLSEAGLVAALNGQAAMDTNIESVDVDDSSETAIHENNGFLEHGMDGDVGAVKQENKDGLVALNLSKAATAVKQTTQANGSDALANGHGDESEREELSDFSDEELDFGNDEHSDHSNYDEQSSSFQQSDNATNTTSSQLPGSATPARVVNKLLAQGYSSVESLLLNVMGLLEVAITTSRFQEQQIKKEAGALSTLYDQEKSLRVKSESLLQREQRLKALYIKRWRKAEKMRNLLKQKLSQARPDQDSKSCTSVSTQTTDPSDTTEKVDV